ncbi:MAG: FAD-binding protein, partial [Elusimicrobia bacterium]|nr:FAD-binding protein [Elusimicrobiota bacterium]
MNSTQTPPALPPKLLDELRAIVGDKHVLTSPGDLFVYSYDAALDRSRPSAVILPGTPEEVAQVVKSLAKSKKSYVARGAATGLAGGAVPLQGAAVIALTRMTSIGRIDPTRREIAVEPGVVNLRLQQTVDPSGFFFAPDPGSQKACTIGGNIAMNAGGPHCLKYGVTASHVMALEVVLPDGQVAQFRVDDPGYDLAGFFVGTEGTLGIVTRARLKLLPKPKAVRTMLVSFNSIEEAIQSVTDIIAAGLLPATLEAMDRTVVEAVEAFSHAGYPSAEAVLLIEVDGDQADELDQQTERIKELCAKNHSGEFRTAKSEL